MGNYYSAAIKVPKIRIQDRLVILLALCLESLANVALTYLEEEEK